MITLKNKNAVTHDTHRYVFSKPADLSFEPGQAAELALDKDGWREEGRPFTFCSMPDAQDIEFVIKSYPDHDGVTEQMAKLEPGAQMTLDGPFGAITDQGPGTFIAAGAGVTPFIPILKKREKDGTLGNVSLFYTNKTEADIILRDQWEAMQGLRTEFTVTDEDASGIHSGMIDKAFLDEKIDDFSQKFYICGPQGFVDDIRDHLKALGAQESDIVTEDGW
jgi:ferredoxin-NADP reductase